MNTVIINGTVSGFKYLNSPDDDDVEFAFVVINNDSDSSDCVNKIPVLTRGLFAKTCYAEICEGSYVEITGTLIRKDSKKCYVLAQNVLAKLPKRKRQFYMKKKEFLHLYKPNSIIEDLVTGQMNEALKNGENK